MDRNKKSNLKEELPWMLPTKFRFMCSSSFKGEFILEIYHSETIIAYGWPCLLTDLNEMNILHRRPSIDASYQA
jgi:hypothetical protein